MSAIRAGPGDAIGGVIGAGVRGGAKEGMHEIDVFGQGAENLNGQRIQITGCERAGNRIETVGNGHVVIVVADRYN